MKNFTNNWFQITAKANFESILLPNKEKIKYAIEIGCYEGQATCWMLENLFLTKLHCIDTWLGSSEHDPNSMGQVFEKFNKNTQAEQLSHQIQVHVGASSLHLKKIFVDSLDLKIKFDFIYIDGSHKSKDVLSDAVLAFDLLNSGGILAFDDYQWIEKPLNQINPLDNPRLAIDMFYNIYRSDCVLLRNNSQFWIKKIN